MRVQDESDEVQAVLKALSDPTRRWLLGQMDTNAATDIQWLRPRARRTRQTLYKHLDVLIRARLVTKSGYGKRIVYHLDPRPLHRVFTGLARRYERDLLPLEPELDLSAGETPLIMSGRPYRSLERLLELLDEPYYTGFTMLMMMDGDVLARAPGSARDHQAWPGGYLDHVREVMNTAVVLYEALGSMRWLPFDLPDALAVLFAHDLEKPWAYEEKDGSWLLLAEFRDKEFAHAFRVRKLASCGVRLPESLERAMRLTKSEGRLPPLAAFTRMCDIVSTRIWPQHPGRSGGDAGRPGAPYDPWAG